MDIDVEDQAAIGTAGAVDGGKTRKGAASTQANDNELRRLLKENRGRKLEDIAKQILKTDSGSKQEKAKQIFGMRWYGSTLACQDFSNLPTVGSKRTLRKL